MNDHHLFKHCSLNFFPKKNNVKFKGVYGFGTVYVGASINVRSRVIAHLNNFFSDRRYNLNNNLYEYFKDAIDSGKKIHIYYLSEDPSDEKLITEVLVGIKPSPLAKYHYEGKRV